MKFLSEARPVPEAPEMPLSVNILRLHFYLLQPDEVVLFDWFIVKQISFKYSEFYYSQARIEKETRIKRSRQNAIISHFKELGFLSAEVRGNRAIRGKVSYFSVNFAVLNDPQVLGKVISMEYYEFIGFLRFMRYHAKMQSGR